MTILSVLYTLIITPLELLFEVIFSIANRLIGNAGLSIVFLSLAVNFLVLPLYKRADELQAEERDVQARMASRLKHIKSTFKGDERFFMVQEYYRINHYKPVYALKSSVSVLLQIPFFIAAYNLLSGMQGLQGMKFGFIADLGKEDAMFMIGNFPINVLPILMTIINVVSGIIYTKGHPLKEKVQVYGLAAVFLVLLYRSPSGLVFYWLLNNVFSLVKNVFYKFRDPKKALNVVLAVAGLAVFISTLIRTDLDARQKVLLSAGGILLALPLLSGFIKRKDNGKEVQKNTGAFVAGTILMALITGLLIPSTVINDSTLEFIDVFQLSNPIIYVVNTMLLSFGCWVLWGGVFYFFMSDKTKALFTKAIWIICGTSIVDYMLFGTKLGTISSILQYDNSPAYVFSDYSINLLALLAIGFVLAVLQNKVKGITKLILVIGILAVTCFGILNSAGIAGMYSGYLQYTKLSSEKPSIPLSKNGKNVIVMMLDRAMGTQVPYIFNEKPELKEKFDGFTYYPNTISFGGCTIIGTPALYGGYEYTPVSMNERNTETMKDKHNQALKVMPVIFGDNGYKVTICDPPFAGYQFNPDLSIYSDHPEFSCYTTLGALSYFGNDGSNDASINVMSRINDIRNRNFFFFSLMKISPVILQETIYNGGLYNEPVAVSGKEGDSSDSFALVQTYQNESKSSGYNMYFLNAYAVISNLSNITEIKDGNENTYMSIDNDTTHYPCYLQQPGYVPKATVDNTAYDVNMVERYTINGVTMDMSTIDQRRHYHVNVAAYQKLSEWFDYLRANGVYDNTRIILVADHGRGLGQFGIKSNGQDMEIFMPLLMVKDFNAKGFTTSEDFMTNADVPTLATSGLIKDPVNPFTGKPINSNAKKNPLTVIYTPIWNPSDLEGTRYPASDRYVISGGNPYDPNSWKYVGEG